MMNLDMFALVSMLLFSIGIVGVISRRNIFVIYMSLELMLNGVNLFFATFAKYRFDMDAQVISMVVIALAAAEAAMFLSIVILLFRTRRSLDTNIFTELAQEESK